MGSRGLYIYFCYKSTVIQERLVFVPDRNTIWIFCIHFLLSFIPILPEGKNKKKFPSSSCRKMEIITADDLNLARIEAAGRWREKMCATIVCRWVLLCCSELAEERKRGKQKRFLEWSIFSLHLLSAKNEIWRALGHAFEKIKKSELRLVTIIENHEERLSFT